MSENRKYQDFGGQLKKLRLKAKKSIADVSGAVELPADQLERIESGALRPHKDLIPVLASYFNLTKAETQRLLNLAGYRKKNQSFKKSDLQTVLEEIVGHKLPYAQQIMLAFTENSSIDDKAIYTNETSINVASNGVVIEFLQSAAINRGRQARNVAKVGMSLEHAYRLRDTLHRALRDFESKKRQSQLDI